MQISVLTKLLPPIRALKTLLARKASAATSESREESNKMQNAEEIMQNADYATQEGANDRQAWEEDDGEAEVETAMPENTVQSSPREASKAHLTSSVPRAARVPRGALSKSEMAELRCLFSDLDDNEIHRLYKRVIK